MCRLHLNYLGILNILLVIMNKYFYDLVFNKKTIILKLKIDRLVYRYTSLYKDKTFPVKPGKLFLDIVNHVEFLINKLNAK